MDIGHIGRYILKQISIRYRIGNCYLCNMWTLLEPPLGEGAAMTNFTSSPGGILAAVSRIDSLFVKETI